MATYEAVGAVGLTLQTLLADRLDHPNGAGGAVPVTLGAPGPERDPEGAAEAARVNLFLFRVSENGCLKNQDLPGATGRGDYGHPPLSLDLHYLLTVYGATANGTFFDETPAHRLLGSAMGILHDHSIITDALVTRRPPAGTMVLDPALRGERERVKLALQPLNIEDFSNVWTALELPYRLSIAYEVSVIQIESGRPRRYPRPVQEPPGAGPRIHAAPLSRPRIASISVRRAGDPPGSERAVPFARVGDTLVVHGSNFGGGGLRVRLDAVELSPAMISASGERLEVIVPDEERGDGTTIPPGERLQPGTRTLEVMAPAPGLPGVTVGSGAAAFTLVPGLSAAAAAGRMLSVEGSRLMVDGLAAQVIVGERVVEGTHYLGGSDSTSVELALPAALPTFPAAARTSGELDPFPALPNQFDLSVTMGSVGPVTATLEGKPASIGEAAALLEAALRAASPAPAFSGARVAAAANALVVVAGDLVSPVAFAAGALANALDLRGASSEEREVYLSGILTPFPQLTAAAPEVHLTIGATSRVVSLGAAPADLFAAASALEAAIRGGGPPAGFAAARVAVLGGRLVLLPGAPVPVAFAPTPSDATTTSELHLAGVYRVRARVGGVESVDEATVALPS